ncbi:MAG: glycosyltransferase family 2 protein [Phycisphaerae bacterium]
MALLSVVIPNFNHGRFLRRRVESVLQQTFKDLEVVLLDDASTDDSLEVIKDFADDPRVRVVVNPANSGQTFRQWRRGAALTKGKYLWIAESDDWAEPTLAERLVGLLEANPGCGVACCESWYDFGDATLWRQTNESHLPESGRWHQDFIADGRQECREHLVTRNTMPNASAVVMRRSVYDAVGGPACSMRLCADWLLWVKMLEISDLAHVAAPLNAFRCDTATVRKRHIGSPLIQAEVFRIISYIQDRFGVERGLLERVMQARRAKFAAAMPAGGYSLAELRQVYAAANEVDTELALYLPADWARWQLGRAGRLGRRTASRLASRAAGLLGSMLGLWLGLDPGALDRNAAEAAHLVEPVGHREVQDRGGGDGRVVRLSPGPLDMANHPRRQPADRHKPGEVKRIQKSLIAEFG